MDQELIPLSEAKTRLHELVKSLEGRDLVLVRHGRPVGVLVGFGRYRRLLELAGRARGEASPAGLDPGVRAEIARVCDDRGVTRLVLFGSAARGEAGPSSDLDLLVGFRPMPPRERADALFGLQEDLERLLGRAVDLVEDEAVDNPYLRSSIERAHTVLYEAA
ncbi:MAG TPA: type II toxin-antitoxin system prevent-host-death family antitoxin [Actinomycetota bacterium]|nr:type II toxin-antitoxin system prevent-host-death family antitoxin [Actinomycetota bacterium]